nr:MAG TPA: hypothetical protein [Caudoviricetes sp.]
MGFLHFVLLPHHHNYSNYLRGNFCIIGPTFPHLLAL